MEGDTADARLALQTSLGENRKTQKQASPSSSPLQSQHSQSAPVSQSFSQTLDSPQPTQTRKQPKIKVFTPEYFAKAPVHLEEGDDDEEEGGRSLSQDPFELCCIEGCHRVHSNHTYKSVAGTLRAGQSSKKMCRTHYIEGLGQCCVKDCNIKATNRNWKAGMASMYTLKKDYVNRPKSKLKVCTDHNAQYSALVRSKKRKNIKRVDNETVKGKRRKVGSEELAFINKTLGNWNDTNTSGDDGSDNNSESDTSESSDGSSSSSSTDASDDEGIPLSERNEGEKISSAPAVVLTSHKRQREDGYSSSDDFMDNGGISGKPVTSVMTQATPPTPTEMLVPAPTASPTSLATVRIAGSPYEEGGSSGGASGEGTAISSYLSQYQLEGSQHQTTERVPKHKRQRLTQGTVSTRSSSIEDGIHCSSYKGRFDEGSSDSFQQGLLELKQEVRDMKGQMLDLHRQLKHELGDKIEALKNEFIPLIKIQLEQAHEREMIQLRLLGLKHNITATTPSTEVPPSGSPPPSAPSDNTEKGGNT